MVLLEVLSVFYICILVVVVGMLWFVIYKAVNYVIRKKWQKVIPLKKETMILVPIMILAAGLRIYDLTEESFWGDEGITATIVNAVNVKSKYSDAFKWILENRLRNLHLPTYFLLLIGWTELFGINDFSLRSVF